MADVKISGLPASTVPLAGTEVLPIVQSGTTKQVSIANVTAGRAIAATSITTDTYKAASSSGGVLQNSSGAAQLQWGSGGGNNLSVDVAININPANAAVAISPTGTGTLTINPATASTMNNVAIGGTTPLAGAFTTATANSFIPNSATIPTNGVYLPAANSVGVATNSNERARFFASGGVSIGNTTDPGATNLSVTGSGTFGSNLLLGSTEPFLYSNGGSGGSVNAGFKLAGSSNLIYVYTAGNISTTFQPSGGVSIGNTTDKGAASLNVSGLIYPQQAATASAPAYVKGAIYFDTTLNKLCVGGATAWETITSV